MYSMHMNSRNNQTGLQWYWRVLLAGIVLCMLSSCSAGRTRVSPGEIPIPARMGRGEEVHGRRVLTELKRHFTIDDSRENNRRVRRIVENLATAANVGAYPWHVYVFRDDTVVNAAATRGNHIFVWTGLLDLVRNDDELAAVLAHEMGHILADHTQPTASEQAGQLIVGIGSNAAQLGVTAAEAPYAANMGGYVVDQVLRAAFVNPGSQGNEVEADLIGIYLMADAGYHPQAALDFWSRVTQSGEGTSGPDLFSSHPSNERRLRSLSQQLPGATSRYVGGQRGAAYDSFSVNDGILNERRTGRNESWVVVAEWAPVHALADRSSPVINHYFHGDRLTIHSKSGPWLRVVEPAPGYVHESVLSQK